MVEKKALNIPYLEGVGPYGLEQQRKVLDEAAQRKAMMEAVRVRGKGTSTQERVLPPKGTLITTGTVITIRT